MPLLGPVVTATRLRRELQRTLEVWLPSTLAELTRRHNADLPVDQRLVVEQPRSWTRLPDEAILELASDQSPMVAAVAGPMENFRRRGDGHYDAIANLGAYVVVRGTTWQETSDVLGIYVAACRVAVAQHGIAGFTAVPARESYREVIPAEKARSIQAGVVRFEVAAKNVLDSSAGPDVPPAPPDYVFSDDPLATSATVAVEPL